MTSSCACFPSCQESAPFNDNKTVFPLFKHYCNNFPFRKQSLVTIREATVPIMPSQKGL